MKNIIMVLAVLICVGFVAGEAYGADKTIQESTSIKVVPKKIQVDSNFDGKIDRIETYDNNGKPMKVEADNDFDGIMDETLLYKDDKPYKTEKDTNKDGKPDVWMDL